MSHLPSMLQQDPWRDSRWQWLQFPAMLELSQRWVILMVVANVIVLLWLGGEWTYNGMRLNEQDAQLASLSEEVDWLRERHEWGAHFVRTRMALEQAAGGKMTKHQVMRLSEILWTQAKNYGFDPLLIIAVIHVESRSNPSARGRYQSGAESGALGLMQLKLGTAQLMARHLDIVVRSEADLMKPDVNLMLGTYYLLRQIVRYGNVSKGLMAYNIGPYALEQRLRSGERLPYGYSGKILKEYRRLTDKFGPI